MQGSMCVGHEGSEREGVGGREKEEDEGEETEDCEEKWRQDESSGKKRKRQDTTLKGAATVSRVEVADSVNRETSVEKSKMF